MSTWPMLSTVGLSLTVAWGALSSGAGTVGEPIGGIRGYSVVVSDEDVPLRPRPAATGEALPLEDADGEEMAATERTCLTPRWGESEACAAFALAAGATVEIELKEVKDTDGNNQAGQISFRLYDVKGHTTVDNKTIPVGGKFTYVNNTDGLLDLVVHAKNHTVASKQTIRFTYEKK